MVTELASRWQRTKRRARESSGRRDAWTEDLERRSRFEIGGKASRKAAAAFARRK
jgi:hypothetical protein